MSIITVASSKGGPGKTTLSQIIAGTLAARGVSVAVLDADPTAGLSRWASRLYEGAAFVCHHEPDEAKLAHLIHRMAQEAEVVVVDTAGFGNRAATVAMTAADGVLIPMVPGEGDVTEAARTVELVAGVGIVNLLKSRPSLSGVQQDWQLMLLFEHTSPAATPERPWHEHGGTGRLTSGADVAGNGHGSSHGPRGSTAPAWPT